VTDGENDCSCRLSIFYCSVDVFQSVDSVNCIGIIESLFLLAVLSNGSVCSSGFNPQ